MITKELEAVFQAAVRDARKRRHEMVCLEHLLLAMLGDPLSSQILGGLGVDLDEVRDQLERWLASLEAIPAGRKLPFEQSVAVTRVLQRAAAHVQSSGKREIDAGDILAAMLREKDSQAVFILAQQGIDRLALLEFISHGEGPAARRGAGDEEGEAADIDPELEEGRGGAKETRDPLADHCVDLVARAREGKIDPLVGRATELERSIHVLCRRRKNNPVLVGEPGVGKTAIAEGLALAIAEGKVPGPIADSEVWALDLGSLIAGTKYRGEFEQRLKGVVASLRKRPRAILFIDEIHTIVGAGAVSGGTLDASNILKPALASGEIRCIGSTTDKDYTSTFEKDRALARRFQKIEVKEPSVEETVRILEGLRGHYESFHGVSYTDDAIRLAVELSAKHLTDRHLPDKAIDVLDEVGAAARLRPLEPAPDGGRRDASRPIVVDVADVEAIVAKMARIPPRTVSRSDRDRLATLERDLKLVLYGQDSAVESLVSAIKLARSGLGSPRRPTGSFLFSGPTGVGKTEMARQLARLLGVELLRFDMSEYMEKHTVSRLIGAPPGYVGFDQGGLLTDAVLKNPYAVLVLDEIEKAHPDIFNILLQVMDSATLTDHTGRKADFRNVIVILTTNAGAAEIAAGGLGFGSRETATADGKKAIERFFAPEFRNRLDAWIPFSHLSTAVIEQVVDKLTAELEEQLRAKGVVLDLSDRARAWLAKNGYDRANGARPMARLLDRAIRRRLADELLFGALEKGGTATVDEAENELVFSFAPREEPVTPA